MYKLIIAALLLSASQFSFATKMDLDVITDAQIEKLAHWRYAQESQEILINAIIEGLSGQKMLNREPFVQEEFEAELQQSINDGEITTTQVQGALYEKMKQAQAYDPMIFRGFINDNLEKYIINSRICSSADLQCDYYINKLFDYADIKSSLLDNEFFRLEKLELTPRQKKVLAAAKMKSIYFSRFGVDKRFNQGLYFNRKVSASRLDYFASLLFQEGQLEYAAEFLAMMAIQEHIEGTKTLDQSVIDISKTRNISTDKVTFKVNQLFSDYVKYLPLRSEWLAKITETFGPNHLLVVEFLNKMAREQLLATENKTVTDTIIDYLNQIPSDEIRIMVFTQVIEFINALGLESATDIINDVTKVTLDNKLELCEQPGPRCFQLLQANFILSKTGAREIEKFFEFRLASRINMWPESELKFLAERLLTSANKVRYIFRTFPNDLIHGRTLPKAILQNDHSLVLSYSKELKEIAENMWQQPIEANTEELETYFGFKLNTPALYEIGKADFQIMQQSWALTLISHVAWVDRWKNPEMFFAKETSREYNIIPWDIVYRQTLVDFMDYESKQSTRKLWIEKIKEEYSDESLVYQQALARNITIEESIAAIAPRFNMQILIDHEQTLSDAGLDSAYYLLRKFSQYQVETQILAERYMQDDNFSYFKAINSRVAGLEKVYLQVLCSAHGQGVLTDDYGLHKDSFLNRFWNTITFRPNRKEVDLLVLNKDSDLNECQNTNFNKFFYDEVEFRMKTTEFFKQHEIETYAVTFFLGLGAGSLAHNLLLKGISRFAFPAGSTYRTQMIRHTVRSQMEIAKGLRYQPKAIQPNAPMAERIKTSMYNKWAELNRSTVKFKPGVNAQNIKSLRSGIDPIFKRFNVHKAGAKILPLEILVDIPVFTAMWNLSMSVTGIAEGSWLMPIAIGMIARSAVPGLSFTLLAINRGKNPLVTKFRQFFFKSAQKGSVTGGTPWYTKLIKGFMGKMATKNITNIQRLVTRTLGPRIMRFFGQSARTGVNKTMNAGVKWGQRNGTVVAQRGAARVGAGSENATHGVSETVTQSGDSVVSGIKQVASELKSKALENQVVPSN